MKERSHYYHPVYSIPMEGGKKKVFMKNITSQGQIYHFYSLVNTKSKTSGTFHDDKSRQTAERERKKERTWEQTDALTTQRYITLNRVQKHTVLALSSYAVIISTRPAQREQRRQGRISHRPTVLFLAGDFSPPAVWTMTLTWAKQETLSITHNAELLNSGVYLEKPSVSQKKLYT